MWGVIIEALEDTVKIIPILYLVYLLIEYFLHRKRETFLKTIAGTKKTGPLIATTLGLIPQCGFSAVMADFYTKRYITIGSLFAIFIATSDEAIILMFSDYKLIPYLLCVLLAKAIIGIAVGYLVDFIFRKRLKESVPLENLDSDIKHNRDCSCDHEHMIEEENEHHHEHKDEVDCNCCTSHIFLHALMRTLEIVIYVLIMNVVIGLLIYYVGLENITSFVKTGTILEPILTALIGLIPNCASSVLLVDLFTSNIINFFSLLGGLCTGSGIGILVLFRKNKNIKENIFIFLSLFIIGVVIGCVGLLV